MARKTLQQKLAEARKLLAEQGFTTIVTSDWQRLFTAAGLTSDPAEHKDGMTFDWGTLHNRVKELRSNGALADSIGSVLSRFNFRDQPAALLLLRNVESGFAARLILEPSLAPSTIRETREPVEAFFGRSFHPVYGFFPQGQAQVRENGKPSFLTLGRADGYDVGNAVANLNSTLPQARQP